MGPADSKRITAQNPELELPDRNNSPTKFFVRDNDLETLYQVPKYRPTLVQPRESVTRVERGRWAASQEEKFPQLERLAARC